MGTRCNIRITYGNTNVYIYRHWDGYLSETGKDVYEKLQQSRVKEYNLGAQEEAQKVNIINFINSFLHDNCYELTTGVHGDIEYMYHFEFNDASLITHLTVYQYNENRSVNDELVPTTYSPWAEGQTSFYNPYEFTFYEVVQKEIEKQEKHIQQLKKQGRVPDYKSLQFKKEA